MFAGGCEKTAAAALPTEAAALELPELDGTFRLILATTLPGEKVTVTKQVGGAQPVLLATPSAMACA